MHSMSHIEQDRRRISGNVWSQNQLKVRKIPTYSQKNLEVLCPEAIFSKHTRIVTKFQGESKSAQKPKVQVVSKLDHFCSELLLKGHRTSPIIIMVRSPQTVQWNGRKKGGQILERDVSLDRTETGMEMSSGRIFYIKKLSSRVRYQALPRTHRNMPK